MDSELKESRIKPFMYPFIYSKANTGAGRSSHLHLHPYWDYSNQLVHNKK